MVGIEKSLVLQWQWDVGLWMGVINRDAIRVVTTQHRVFPAVDVTLSSAALPRELRGFPFRLNRLLFHLRLLP